MFGKSKSWPSVNGLSHVYLGWSWPDYKSLKYNKNHLNNLNAVIYPRDTFITHKDPASGWRVTAKLSDTQSGTSDANLTRWHTLSLISLSDLEQFCCPFYCDFFQFFSALLACDNWGLGCCPHARLSPLQASDNSHSLATGARPGWPTRQGC